jgi:hypothetical protein
VCTTNKSQDQQDFHSTFIYLKSSLRFSTHLPLPPNELDIDIVIMAMYRGKVTVIYVSAYTVIRKRRQPLKSLNDAS